MTFGQDGQSFAEMGADADPIYTSMVNLNSVELQLSVEILERGMPLALKIIIPVFAILTVGLGILIAWCLFGGEEEDGGAGAGGDSGNEDKAGLNVNFFFLELKIIVG
jgi:hypothetical protein